MELVKPVEPVLWASIVELVIGGTGYGTVEALVVNQGTQAGNSKTIVILTARAPYPDVTCCHAFPLKSKSVG